MGSGTRSPTTLLAAAALALDLAGHCLAEAPAKGKVIAAYREGLQTELVLQMRERIIAGGTVYIGDDEIEATVDDLLSQAQGLFYYNASVAGKVSIKAGDAVRTERAVKLEVPEIIRLKIEENYTFAPKSRAMVTAVQGKRAMIDRGTLHEVRERDLYAIFDSSDRYKGFLEVRGIGDLQSSGILYNRLFDRRKLALRTEPGDRAAYAGQRKLLGLALVGGFGPSNETILGRKVSNVGGGLLWNPMLMDGWGVEVLFGGYFRSVDAGIFLTPDGQGGLIDLVATRKASYIAPTWIKKNFFYPAVISPYLGVGFALFDGLNRYRQSKVFPVLEQSAGEESVTTIVPMLGGGVELFPARFVRPRFEVRWLKGPKLETAGNTFYTEMVFISGGVFTAW